MLHDLVVEALGASLMETRILPFTEFNDAESLTELHMPIRMCRPLSGGALQIVYFNRKYLAALDTHLGSSESNATAVDRVIWPNLMSEVYSALVRKSVQSVRITLIASPQLPAKPQTLETSMCTQGFNDASKPLR